MEGRDLQCQISLEEVHAHAFATGQDVKRQGHIQILRCRPEWIIIRMAVGALVRRLRPNHCALHPFLGDALQFLHTRTNILQGNQPQWDKPFRVVTAILHRPVVIGAEASYP
jgi:hypothetical protein